MALPKLNDTPKYDLVIPSTKEKVRFRPYLVKEEKVLMLALESKDSKQAIKSIVDTIGACVVEPINLDKLKIFDVEYMFTQIRSKSVGETSTVGLKCKECNHQNDVTIEIDSIKVDVPEVNPVVKINDQISLKLKWPNYKSLMDVDTDEGITGQTFNMVMKCLDTVLTEEEQISFAEHSKEEIQAFLDSLTTSQFDKIKTFIQAMPRMKHDIRFHCNHCNHENHYMLEGIQDFF
jgi:DNA-directed RNA polymerase subunit M/transcription elongation factor TFIIS